MLTYKPLVVPANILSPSALNEVIAEHDKCKKLVEDIANRIRTYSSKISSRKPSGEQAGTARFCRACLKPYDTGDVEEMRCPRCANAEYTEPLAWTTPCKARINNLAGKAQKVQRLLNYLPAAEVTEIIAHM